MMTQKEKFLIALDEAIRHAETPETAAKLQAVRDDVDPPKPVGA